VGTVSVLIILLAGCGAREHDPAADPMLKAVLWQQAAGESRALQHQAYRLARMRLDDLLAEGRFVRKPAVVVDIDETVLDNSPYQARLIRTGTHYPEGWAEWCARAEAEPVPGALDFLSYCRKKGVVVFYVSNRRESTREGTVKNLADHQFPFADNPHVLLRGENTTKEMYRQKIHETHEILLLIGDNLNDFSAHFYEKPAGSRNSAVDSLAREFGNRFILLPNPMYGDWEGAVLNYYWNRSREELDQTLLNALTDY
jgi:5'-nucleotidase (lipoprotein e(P4) family)